jgi:hypothetical protein
MVGEISRSFDGSFLITSLAGRVQTVEADVDLSAHLHRTVVLQGTEQGGTITVRAQFPDVSFIRDLEE